MTDPMQELIESARALLTGTLVRLRPMRDADIPAVTEMDQDPEVAILHSMTTAPGSETVRRESFAKWGASGADRVGFAIEALVGPDGGPTLVGALAISHLEPKGRTGSFHIVLGREHLGRGYGTDAARVAIRCAFEELGLHRLELDVGAVNERAIRAYQRAGFVVEGRAREVRRVGGAWHDLVRMAILETDAR